MIDSSLEYSEPLDMLKIFFHSDFPITDKITIHKPLMGEIIDYPDGESAFLFVVYVFVGNTTHFKVQLWDNGIDWNEITDFEMFCDMVTFLSKTQTEILFKDIDFTLFQKVQRVKDNELVELLLYDPINDIEITELTYFRMRYYLRHIFNIFPDIEVGIKKKRVKEEIINYDRKKSAKNAESSVGSYYLPLISACLNYSGFKYNSEQIKHISIVEFLDSVQRIPINERSSATLHGMMSGFVDGTKISPEMFDFFKDIYSGKRSMTKQEKADLVNKESLHDENK